MKRFLFVPAVLLAAGCAGVGNHGSDVPSADGGADVADGVDAPCVFDAIPIQSYDAGDADPSEPLFPGGQAGADSRLVFSYQSGDFGGLPFRPMLAGTHETFMAFVLPWGIWRALPPLTASSSHGAVMSISMLEITRMCCPADGTDCNDLPTGRGCSDCAGDVFSFASIGVVAGTAGDTVLALRTDDGAEFETLRVSVRDATTLRAEQLRPDGTLVPIGASIAVQSGQTARIRTSAFDAQGTQLEARYGITYTSSAPRVCAVREPGFTIVAPTYSASVDSFDAEVKGVSVGSATLTITAGGAETSVNVDVY